MKSERICRRCLLFESGRTDVLEEIRRHIEKIPSSDRIDDSVYQDRLTTCSTCDQLADGTCLRCGCYPEFRAAFRKQTCPAKEW